MSLAIALLSLTLLANPGDKPDIRGWLGINGENLSAPMKTALKTDYGVLVVDVVENSPAQKGGIELGDVILEFDSEKIYEYDDLVYLIKKNPNKKVVIVILRQGSRKKLNIEIGAKEYESTFLKLPPFRFPEDLERAFKNLKPKWEEEMEELREEIKELRKELEKLRAEIEKKTKI